MVFRSGILVESRPSEGLLQLDARTAQTQSEDSCSVDSNYERDLPADDETLYWSRVSDASGETLLLRGPETPWSLFRPMDIG